MPDKKPDDNSHPDHAIVTAVKADAKKTRIGVSMPDASMWRLVADSAVDAITVFGTDGNIALWNRTAETMFGWRSEEVLGKLLTETILPVEHREALTASVKKYLKSGEAFIFEKRIQLNGICKDGRQFPIELAIVPQSAKDGHTFVAFVRDMSEQIKLNERMRQSQKMEAIGILAGGIAHDFNNIITAITGNVLLARADVPPSHPLQESLAEIEKAAKRATYVVRQILTFSSAKKINAQNIDLEVNLVEAIKLLKATLPSSFEIETHFEPNLPAIFADSTDIHQIILNLGINANHAMGGRAGKFEIQVSQVFLDEATAQSLNIAPGRCVRLSVGDTGCGMDASTLNRIFEPFFTTKVSGEGTGLGLSVVYGIVTRSFGAINVSSELGRGTVFRIYFPAVLEKAVIPDRGDATLPSGNGEKILYVDDDEALVFMMTRMLRRLNYDVLGFQNAKEALEAFRGDPSSFDAVITDMSMPQMDGAGLVSELQAIRQDLPIIMVTGYIRPKDLEQALHLGISDLILKPNSTEEMAETLHRVLAEAHAKVAGPGS